ncbi:MAG: hypothetical protein JWM19_4258 [Actinomycetia bacterium]|nr:hypothetical protein [Actinomycetes bacterium]
MQSLDDGERRAVLGEVLADELKAIAEYVKDMPLIMKKVEGVFAAGARRTASDEQVAGLAPSSDQKSRPLAGLKGYVTNLAA